MNRNAVIFLAITILLFCDDKLIATFARLESIMSQQIYANCTCVLCKSTGERCNLYFRFLQTCQLIIIKIHEGDPKTRFNFVRDCTCMHYSLRTLSGDVNYVYLSYMCVSALIYESHPISDALLLLHDAECYISASGNDEIDK